MRSDPRLLSMTGHLSILCPSRKWLLLLGLTAGCGEPGARDPWLPPASPVAQGGRGTAAPAGARGEGRAGRPPRPEMTTFRGAYRRTSTDISFLPCGASKSYEVIGDALALRTLRERWRWISVQFERPVFVVVGAAIVPDTVAAADSAVGGTGGPRIVERLFVTRVDSVRVWAKGDCGLARAPRW